MARHSRLLFVEASRYTTFFITKMYHFTGTNFPVGLLLVASSSYKSTKDLLQQKKVIHRQNDFIRLFSVFVEYYPKLIDSRLSQQIINIEF